MRRFDDKQETTASPGRPARVRPGDDERHDASVAGRLLSFNGRPAIGRSPSASAAASPDPTGRCNG